MTTVRHDYTAEPESVGAILARLAETEKPSTRRWRDLAPLRELDMWDYMAVGFFAGAMLVTILAVTIYYWTLMH